MKTQLLFLLVFCTFSNFIKCDENIYIVNTKRPLHIVNDKFLSISVDPAILLTRINLSDISLKMARHLSPAYVRIAGPSTEFVKYIDSDESTEIDSNGLDSVIVTPSVWFAINRWFSMANLTPVFGINDAETAMGVWNPKSILPLFEISDKFNLTCLWQLGYDCSNKTDIQYIEDLKILRHILDAFPDKKKSWNIVGSNVRECSTHQGARRTIDELKGIADYVMWEDSDNEIDTKMAAEDSFRNFLTAGRNNPKIWTVGSKSRRPVTFNTALEWAKEVGDAAKNGFDVILRQPRLHEFFIDTPVFWFSLLYKTLVGNVILDVKPTGHQSGTEAYAYCARNQNNFIHRGAMVVMIVNPEDTEHVSQVRIGMLAKSMEVQSYILTTKTDMREAYLNGERLQPSLLNEEKITLVPKLRRAKPINGVSFTVPPKSIGFFVLPGAKISTCMDEEVEMPLLMEEIQDDQDLPFSDEVAVNIDSRLARGNSKNLKEMQRNLEEELKTDEKFYHIDKKGKMSEKLEDILENMREKYETQSAEPELKFKIDDETRKMILERAKISEAQKKLTESEQRFIDLGKLLLTKSNSLSGHSEKTKRDSVATPPSLFHNEQSIIKPFLPLKTHPFHHFKPRDHKNALSFPSLNNLLNHEHLKLKPTKLHEQLRKISEKSKYNFLKKHGMLEKAEETKPSESDVQLELSSSEVKKILADRVKSRAEKTNIRFSNDELAALMKKATDRLKFNHILRQRGKRQILEKKENFRSKRGINMKLLNEVTKNEDLKKAKNYLRLMDESEEFIPKKESKRKLTYTPKQIIVSPSSKNTLMDKDSAMDWSDYDSDFYFDENDSGDKKKNIHKFHDFSMKKSHKSKKERLSELGRKKLPIKTPKFNTRSNDDDDENEFERKYMRLEEYFKNAKQIQEKYDDIDFSGDSDYKDMDSGEKPIRFKRNDEKTAEKCAPTCGCDKSNGSKCKCEKRKEEVMKMIHSLLREANKKENKVEYKKLADSINGKYYKKGVSKRSINNTLIHSYKSVFDHPYKRKPEDILLLGRTLKKSSRNHGAAKINDFYLYKHLLHGNDIKRSIDDNKINEDFNGNSNEIRKELSDDGILTKNSITTLNPTPTPRVYNETPVIEEINKFKFEIPIKTPEKASNIQKVPKAKSESVVKEMVQNFTSFMCRVGNHIKNYFEGLVK